MDENGNRFAFGIAVKNWEADGFGAPLKEDVTNRPEISEESEIELPACN